MFNLMCVRSDPLPRIRRQLQDPATPTARTAELAHQLAAEEAKASQGRRENALRRHNLVPLVLELVQALARAPGRDGKTALEVARERAREVAAERKRKGQDEDD